MSGVKERGGLGMGGFRKEVVFEGEVKKEEVREEAGWKELGRGLYVFLKSVSFTSRCEEHSLIWVLILDTFEGVLRDSPPHSTLHQLFTFFICHSLCESLIH